MRQKELTIPEIKIWPVEEMVHEDEFTDRVELLCELGRLLTLFLRGLDFLSRYLPISLKDIAG
ncbi:hypothetical protein [Candidatus Electrothrix sp.]|uniref:hypothetical protein n=1 Tax=Candidatus Electrothrix sp. TaxID=2170559 RepID=UPI004056C9E0